MSGWAKLALIEVPLFALYIGFVIHRARKGKLNRPFTQTSRDEGAAHARVVIEYRERPWRPWVWMVEHSRGGESWWLWRQGHASTLKAAHRKARRALTPPYGTPAREELLVVREFAPSKYKEPERQEPLLHLKHFGGDSA